MKLAIIGNGEMASELYRLIMACDIKNDYEDIFFVDLKENKPNNVISEEEFFNSDKKDTKILIATGEPYLRKKLAEKYKEKGFEFTKFIHPGSTILSTDIEDGVIILPYVYIAQNVHIGENTLLHAGVKIENDCIIGENNFISSNAFVGAKTVIKDNCFIGPSACIRDSLVIGEDSIIGMGSNVTKSIAANSVCFGNPAKFARENTTKKVFG